MAGNSNSCDWRSQLTPERYHIVMAITNCFMKKLMFASDRLEEVKRIAGQFEENTYTDATSKDDYMQRISHKLKNMKTKVLVTPTVNPSHPNTSASKQISANSGSSTISPTISQQQSTNALHFKGQPQYQVMKQDIQHPYLLNTQIQQQSFLQPGQLQSSQPPLMQMPSTLQSGPSTIQRTHPAVMQLDPKHNLRHSQQNVNQQSVPSLIQPHQQSIPKQQHGQHTLQHLSNSIRQQSGRTPQQLVMPLHQQQPFTSQQSNMSENQMVGQQNYVLNMQQWQPMQRHSSHLNNIIHQQLGHQNSISMRNKQQLLGSQSSVLGVKPNQSPRNRLQPLSNLQRQNQEPSITLVKSPGHQSHHQSPHQQQIHLAPSQAHVAMQQHQNSLQRDMQQSSGVTVQSNDTMEQQDQSTNSHSQLQEISSTSKMDSTRGPASAVDLQEAIYQKIRFLKESHHAELSQLHRKLSLMVNQLIQEEALMLPDKRARFEKFKFLLSHVVWMIMFLQTSRNDIGQHTVDELLNFQSTIMRVLGISQQIFWNPGGSSHSLQQQPADVQQRQQISSATSMQIGPISSLHHEPVPLPTHVTAPEYQSNTTTLVAPKLKQIEHMPQKMHQSRQLMPQQQKQQQLKQPQMQQFNIEKQRQGAQIPVHHIDDVSHSSDIKPEICRRRHPRKQLENSGSIHIYSQKKMQDSSPQITQHAPHEDIHSTPSCNPIFKVPSMRGNPPLLDPSLAPSVISRGSQKFNVIPLQTNSKNVGQQTAEATPKGQALNDATPGVSVSPLPAELTSTDRSQANTSTSLPSIPITTEDPMERLIKVAKHALLDEISEINRQLIDTIVSIAEEDDSIDVENGSAVGTIAKFCFTAVSLSPSFRSEFTSGLLSPIKPLRLLVPADYPNCSPIVLDKLQLDESMASKDLSDKVKRMFDGSIHSCVQPMLLKEMAKIWDATVYKVIREYAEQSGGGGFSSIYGTWESALTNNFLPSWGRTGFSSHKVQQAR